MSTTSRRISQRIKGNRNSHTPGREKGAYCVRTPDAELAISLNPYKGAGLKGQNRSSYQRFWDRSYSINGVKKESV